ncbi:DUF2254 domain-containing protein [soil metagenome]
MQLSKLRERWQTSLWIVPTVGALLALALAFGLLALDHELPQQHAAWYLFDGGPDAAQHVLSVVTASMLTFTALVFSITVLVLQLASTQFSPRVIRTFLHQATTKWTMGVFVGTFVYAISVLSQVRQGPPVFVPGLATWGALVLVLASVGVFINYIHHMAHAVRAISLITSVGDETRLGIASIYLGQLSDVDEQPAPVPASPPKQLVFHGDAPGVITALDLDVLRDVARRGRAVVETMAKIGDFVATGMLLARVWDAELDPEQVCDVFTFEIERTPNQDPGCGLRQLVDIASRALSPGINDPTTAIQALDQLHDLLRRITLRALPPRSYRDEDGTLRLHIARASYAELVALITREISLYGKSSPRIVDRVRVMLDDCILIAPPARRAVLEQHRAQLSA